MKPAFVLAAFVSCVPLAAACNQADADDGSSRPYKVGVVDRGEVRVTVEETGVVEPERSIVVKSPISGVVQELYAREGDRVQPGQALARILPDIAQANSFAQLGSEIAAAQIARRLLAGYSGVAGRVENLPDPLHPVVMLRLHQDGAQADDRVPVPLHLPHVEEMHGQ